MKSPYVVFTAILLVIVLYVFSTSEIKPNEYNSLIKASCSALIALVCLIPCSDKAYSATLLIFDE